VLEEEEIGNEEERVKKSLVREEGREMRELELT